jgi:hypothetical protein
MANNRATSWRSTRRCYHRANVALSGLVWSARALISLGLSRAGVADLAVGFVATHDFSLDSTMFLLNPLHKNCKFLICDCIAGHPI